MVAGSVKPCAVLRLPASRMTRFIQLMTLGRIDRFNCGLFADIKVFLITQLPQPFELWYKIRTFNGLRVLIDGTKHGAIPKRAQ